MFFPIRCMTCGAIIGSKHQTYTFKVSEKKTQNTKNIAVVEYLTKNTKEKTIEGEVLDELQITKLCCRSHFLTHVEIV